jgi:hypothetical protein
VNVQPGNLAEHGLNIAQRQSESNSQLLAGLGWRDAPGGALQQAKAAPFFHRGRPWS